MDIAVIILAAGQGTRMKSRLPKVLHPLCGRPMLHTVLETASLLSPKHIVAVIGPDMENVAASVREACPDAVCVVQLRQLGTADAVQAALPQLAGFSGPIVILYGDTPLIRPETVQAMLEMIQVKDCAVTVLGFTPHDPAEYGRLVAEEGGELSAIVEFREASAEERRISLCNSGVMAIKGGLLPELLKGVDNHNAKGEYYLTDIIAIAKRNNQSCRFVEAEEEEVLGINSRQQLAAATHVAQKRLRLQAMENGATLIDPETVTFCFDTKLGRDVTIHPYVVFGTKVQVEEGVEIKSFSHIEGAVIGAGSLIGPFARLRTGSVIGKAAKVGNFVEIKNSHLGEGSKVNHLSYIGDADIGSKSNIGAGTITCNYDGFHKYRTTIGKDTLIGSNSSLIAPLTIGDGVIVGAGSVITANITDNALSISRAEQVNLEGKGEEIRKRKGKR